MLERARAAALPVPRIELIAEVPGATALVQSRLPGSVPEPPSLGQIQEMAALMDRCAGLAAGLDAPPPLDLHLRSSGPGFCLHETLAAYDARTARLLGRIKEIGAAAPDAVPGDDLVHGDYHPGNVLADPETGALTGIVDWDGIARGDRLFMLVNLRWGVHWGAGPGVAAWLDGELDRRVPAGALRRYWASLSLRMVDWMVRHGTPENVTEMIELAESRL
ncbi:hypothetical protein BIV57_21485 [Mangrovactinospora gilvigrisea]|uniref:Aminoglycoside phosphotransferase domain-containing protein n=1 Tax=Mangrovactinospora gilvigrisea TaxID=1428644 RepID=A0A1J7B9V4_9ACTN|nr:hypothetical protein BIV57_21485 [Mangrovactinospora gilvigrisea]